MIQRGKVAVCFSRIYSVYGVYVRLFVCFCPVNQRHIFILEEFSQDHPVLRRDVELCLSIYKFKKKRTNTTSKRKLSNKTVLPEKTLLTVLHFGSVGPVIHTYLVELSLC
jgi:hypothetical protein